MDSAIKVVLLGDSGVGKTSIVQRFAFDNFESSNQASCGAGFTYKSVTVPELRTDIRFKIWDTAGQERYHSMASIYYQDAAAAVIVYDTTNIKSFDGIKTWVDELKMKGPKNIFLMIVGNKSDLINPESINIDTAVDYSTTIGAEMMLVSAKENINITEIFKQIAIRVPKEELTSDETEEENYSSKRQPSIIITRQEHNKKKSIKCC